MFGLSMLAELSTPRGFLMTEINASTSGDPPAARFDTDQWSALVLLCTAAFMIVLDGSTVITALPSIQADLGFSASDLHWVATSYALTFGGLMLLGGRLADLVGRRRVFMTGVVIFIITSLLCGLAWSSAVLVAGRFLQGVGAAIALPAALSILMTTFEEGPARNKALGVWLATGSAGGIVGYIVGGLLTDGPGWEWIFYVNVPVGVGVLALSPVLLSEERDRDSDESVDFAGAVAITVSLIALVYAITMAPDLGLAHWQTGGLLAVSTALFAVFVRIEARSRSPLVPLRLFRSRTLVGGNLILIVAGMSLSGALYILTLYMQQVLGYSATQFAIAMLVPGVTSIVGAYAGQHLVTKAGLRPVVLSSIAGIVVALGILTQVSVGGNSPVVMLATLVLLGVGVGGLFAGASIAALTGVPDGDDGIAAGIEETTYQIGSPIGIAILSAVAVSRTEVLFASGSETLIAQTAGYRLAFAVAIVFALFGVVFTLIFLDQPDDGPDDTLEAAEAECVQNGGFDPEIDD